MSGSGRITSVTINRAPVLTLWAAVVAERLGHDREAALTLGKAIAGLNAQSKGRRLGIYAPGEKGGATHAHKPGTREASPSAVELMGRAVPAVKTHEGLRAVHDGKPMSAESVERYLEAKFKDGLDAARDAMEALAKSLAPDDLAAQAFALYEHFRPEIPRGKRGWGAAGVLDLERIRALARPGRAR